jgi:hypothetical protein
MATRTYFVDLRLASQAATDTVGVYNGPVPEPGEIIDVLGRSRRTYKARVSRIDLESRVPIHAVEVHAD